MTLQVKRITYEEYLKMPEIKERYDIVNGIMIMAPAPTLDHRRILRELSFLLHQFVTEHGLGEIFFAPADVIVRRAPLRTRQPDLLFVSTERNEILGQVVEGAPDLVVEILSPGNIRSEIQDKLADYARLGVKECWLVSSEAGTVEILSLSNGDWQRLALVGLGDKIKSNVFEGLDIETSQFFV